MKIVDKTNFKKFVVLLRKKHKYVLSQIGNADQTPVWFCMPQSTAVEHAGERSVQVRMKQCCTVMLAITADGHKLPPFVIFKDSSPVIILSCEKLCHEFERLEHN